MLLLGLRWRKLLSPPSPAEREVAWWAAQPRGLFSSGPRRPWRPHSERCWKDHKTQESAQPQPVLWQRGFMKITQCAVPCVGNLLEQEGSGLRLNGLIMGPGFPRHRTLLCGASSASSFHRPGSEDKGSIDTDRKCPPGRVDLTWRDGISREPPGRLDGGASVAVWPAWYVTLSLYQP